MSQIRIGDMVVFTDHPSTTKSYIGRKAKVLEFDGTVAIRIKMGKHDFWTDYIDSHGSRFARLTKLEKALL